MLIAACVKWVELRPDVDPLHGTVAATSHAGGFSDADLSAVEVALRLADAWSGEVVVVCAGPPDADRGLRDLLATGVSRAVRVVPAGGDRGPLEPDAALGTGVGEAAAALLSSVLGAGDLDADVVVCGDVSVDIGSGTVPAYLAHHLGAAQASGLVEVTPVSAGSLRAVRRLDGGRREVLDVDAPAVLSVEGGVAELRRAGLGEVLRARDAVVGVREARVSAPTPPISGRSEAPRLRPWRPPGRAVAAPTGRTALDRVIQLTGAFVERTPPRTVTAEPAAAAAAIVDQLRTWGYLPER